MRQVRLGRTGLMVSQVGFGGIPIRRLTKEQAVAILRHCLDLGVNFIDTAHGYGDSELMIGEAIRGRREGLVLATKSHALTGDEFRRDVEQSFERLGTDYIDIIQFHNPRDRQQYDQVMATGGPYEVARELQAAGRIGHIGISAHSHELALEYVVSGHFDTLMYPFTFVSDDAVDLILPLCEEHDVGFIAMKPFAGGMLEDAGLIYRWMNQFPYAVTIPGIDDPRQMDEIVRIVESEERLTEEDMVRIEALRGELVNQFCHGCDYCQPCPAEIPISSFARVRSFVKRSGTQELLNERQVKARAAIEDCQDCGVCETRCPYDLPIRQLLRLNAEWYDEQMALLNARG